MEAADASSSGDRKQSLLNLPTGYHFAPTHEELIIYYLRPKIAGFSPLLPIFQEKNVIEFGPEEITAKYREFGADERWYFFTTREQKYSIGNRPNRTTVAGGSWKATGPQKLIHSVKDGERTLVGRARTLVFYKAPPKETGLPKGKKKQAQSEEKTSWTMFEYENLTSEEEAADRNVNKLDEYVLCTIQKQKKKDVRKEGTGTAGKKKVKAETEDINGKAKSASKKRKVKQEQTEAENITDQSQIEDLHLMKRSKAPMLPAHLRPEEGYEMGMFDNSCPMKSLPVLKVHKDESPLSEILSPAFIDTDCSSPNMAPTPCPHDPPRSEMTSTSAGGGGNYNTRSAGSNGISSTEYPWYDESLFPEIERVPYLPGNTNSFNPSMVPMPVPQELPHQYMRTMEYETSSYHLRYNYHNIAPSLVTYQPATNYVYRHPVAAPTITYTYHGSAAQNTADQGYMAMLMGYQSLGGRFAASSQYHGGPFIHGTSLPQQDQVAARM